MPRSLLIEGYDGTERIYSRRVRPGYFSDRQLEEVLRALAAKAGLNFNEIVGAYARRRTRIANDLLSVQKDVRHRTWSCGDSPHFTARLVDSDA